MRRRAARSLIAVLLLLVKLGAALLPGLAPAAVQASEPPSCHGETAVEVAHHELGQAERASPRPGDAPDRHGHGHCATGCQCGCVHAPGMPSPPADAALEAGHPPAPLMDAALPARFLAEPFFEPPR